MEKKKIEIIFQTKCRLCGKKIRGKDEELCKDNLSKHIDNECKTVSLLRELEKDGIFKEYIEIISCEELEKSLKKLIKRYGFEKVEDILSSIKEEEK